MNRPALLKEVIPENNKAAGFNEFDVLEFSLDFENAKMVANTVRLEFDVRCKNSAGNNIPTDSVIKFDSKAGGHCFVDQITTETRRQGVLEVASDCARLEKMITEATENSADMLNSGNICQLKQVDDELIRQIIRGIPTRTAGSTVNRDNDVSLKLPFCLNRAAGIDNPADLFVKYETTGTIRISVQLARNVSVFYGNQADGATYTIKNPRLTYVAVPDDNEKQGRMNFRTQTGIKASVQSNQENIACKVPSVCNAMSISFIRQARENDYLFNNLACEPVPDLEELTFTFNNSLNEFVTYTIRNDRPEVLSRYIESIRDSGKNNATLQKLKANDCYGVGLSFGEFVDLSSQTVGVNLKSAVTNVEPMTAFLYFHGVISL